MTTFNDLYKPFKDFFTKNFPTAPLRLEAKLKDSDGLVMNPSVEQATDGKVLAAVEFEQPFPIKDLGRGVGKVNINTNDRAKFEFKAIHPSSGVELTKEFDCGTKDSSKDKATITAEKKCPNGVMTVVGSIPFSAEPTVDARFTRRFNRFTLGLSSTYGLKSQLMGVTAAALHKTEATSVILQLETIWGDKPKQLLRLGTLYTTPSQVTLGTEIVASNTVDIQAAIQKAYQGTTLRSKVTSRGVVSISAQRKLSDNLTGTVNAEWDTTKGSTGKVGLKLMWE